MAVSELEESFATQIGWVGLPVPIREHRFDTIGKRRWRLDFYWEDYLMAVEIEGGVNGARGRHIRPSGFREDCEKYNHAALMGITVIRVTGDMVTDGTAIAFVEEWFRCQGTRRRRRRA